MDKRFDVAKNVGIIGIIGNAFLFIIKIIVGLVSHSQSMIADALNSAGDIFASFMTWLGNRISSVPNDEDHNYGHGKAEYIFSMLISISMMIVAIKLLFDGVISIIFGNKLIFSWLLVSISITTIIVKLCLYLYTKNIYKRCRNLLVKANMVDHRNDMVISSLTTIAILLTKLNIYWFDGVIGIAISIWIFLVGIKIYMESYDVLMDSSINKRSQKAILNVIKSYKEVKRIGNLYSIPIGYKYIIVITIFVDGNMHTIKSHDITDKMEKSIMKQVERIDKVIIHVEPFYNKKKHSGRKKGI